MTSRSVFLMASLAAGVARPPGMWLPPSPSPPPFVSQDSEPGPERPPDPNGPTSSMTIAIPGEAHDQLAAIEKMRFQLKIKMLN